MCDIGLILQALPRFRETHATIATESRAALNQLDRFQPNLLNKWIYSAMSRNQTPTETGNISTESESQLRTND